MQPERYINLQRRNIVCRDAIQLITTYLVDVDSDGLFLVLAPPVGATWATVFITGVPVVSVPARRCDAIDLFSTGCTSLPCPTFFFVLALFELTAPAFVFERCVLRTFRCSKFTDHISKNGSQMISTRME
jgi:hypothetical protein